MEIQVQSAAIYFKKANFCMVTMYSTAKVLFRLNSYFRQILHRSRLNWKWNEMKSILFYVLKQVRIEIFLYVIDSKSGWSSLVKKKTNYWNFVISPQSIWVAFFTHPNDFSQQNRANFCAVHLRNPFHSSPFYCRIDSLEPQFAHKRSSNSTVTRTIVIGKI